MKLQTRWCKYAQLDTLTLERILALRQQVFIIEQQSIYADIDGLDPISWHVLLEHEQQLFGYARLFPDDEGKCYRLQRIVLAKNARGMGQGKALMESLIGKAQSLQDYPDLQLSAQVHLQDFYRGWGFTPKGPEYDDGGILHVDMHRPLVWQPS
ncbi:GNAT family N-acetyltransferase [Lacimicrobium sp. SS2-24]|uniref:GNAT family N-acetyltransferase n=1 Tax=Lacimicrobium sp. SS2-24 TaxID=2005569 RepID=UPI000B4A84A2|nr:GNAT family N-acetyltransferase [Lacimicrobium sp. SS2-24]